MSWSENKPDYASFEPPAKFQAIESIIAKRLIEHPNAYCSYSGGSDSDTMLDLIERVRIIFNLPPIRYVFFNTGLEMQATKSHIEDMRKKYDVQIDEVRPKMSIVSAVRKYGQPFISKQFSRNLGSLYKKCIPLTIADEYNEAVDKKAFVEKLYQQYPGSRQDIQFICSCNKFGDAIHSQNTINCSAYLREFMIENPPTFKIGSSCCDVCKKNPAHQIEKIYDMTITGERIAEGGVRSVKFNKESTANGCFAETSNGRFRLRPLYYVTDKDKEWYKDYYGLRYSDAYEVYGMRRTGCCGCSINYRAAEDLEVIRPFEPNFVKAAWNVFGDSYRYRAQYNEYRQKRREEEATKREEAQPKPPLTGEDVCEADRKG